jgi:large-conductance mechanosensitive channel
VHKNAHETINVDSNSINTKRVVIVICLIVLGVGGFYFANFHNGLSIENGDWGTFGDYFGGILNPVIAAFAFYLIAKTYELQKRELEATRSLLKESTDSQKNQIKLAALTALLNSNLTRISLLKNENLEILKENGRKSNDGPKSGSNDLEEDFLSGFDAEEFEKEIRKNLAVINELTERNKGFESQIEILCNQFN